MNESCDVAILCANNHVDRALQLIQNLSVKTRTGSGEAQMTRTRHSTGLACKIGTAVALLAFTWTYCTKPADADSAWWFGIFKPISLEAKSVTGDLELSPDYIFFIFGNDVGLQWRQVSCTSKTCIFEVLDPKPVKLKDGNPLCSENSTVRYIDISRAGKGKYSVSFMPSKDKATACFTASYKQ